MGIIKGFHDPKSMDKWVSPRTINKIENIEAIIALLQNPMMVKPIEELGLKPETVEALKANRWILDFGAQLAYLSESKIHNFDFDISNDIIDLLKRNNIEVDKLQDLTEPYLRHTYYWLREIDSEVFQTKFNEAITFAEEDLAEAKKERAEELSRLHFVKIVLPQTLNLLNPKQKVTDTAYECLQVEFSRAVDETCQLLVSRDISTIQNGVKVENSGWFNRLIDRVTESLKKPKPSKETGTNGVECFSLQFAVSANLDEYPERLEMLKPIFAKVALKLSETKLTAKICDRLSPEYSAPDNAPKGHNWINVQTPYEHEMR